MRKDQPNVFDRFEAGEDVSGAEMLSATAGHFVVGLAVAVVQWIGCLIAIVLAFYLGGAALGITAVVLVLWWAIRQAVRGLKQSKVI